MLVSSLGRQDLYDNVNVLAVKYVVSVIIGFSSVAAIAQDLHELGVKKGIKVTGSFNVNAVGYYAHGIDGRRDPYNWFLTGALNIKLLGYDAPFSFSYSNASRSYSQPFNQFSFTPQYKWVKTYVGYNSMTFSSYTLSGYVFLGGGVELTPGKWRIAAMYGRLKRAVLFADDDSISTSASFRRMGYGLKVGYESNGNTIAVNCFTAKDDVNSIPYILYASDLKPKQNIAMSITGRRTFLKRFFVEGEYAVSVLNNDTRAGSSDSSGVKETKNFVNGLLPTNTTTRYFDAINASIGYQGNAYTIQFRYERVAPEYETLGAYYFNNDMRNITIVPSVRLLKGKFNVNANVGVQQNNLDRARVSTTKRTVGSLNMAYVPNEKWSIATAYSNFTAYTNIRPQADPFFQNTLDTLNFYQVNQTTTISVVRNFGDVANPQSAMLTGSYQQAGNNAQYEGGNNNSVFVTINAAYSYTLTASNTTIALSGHAYRNKIGDVSMIFYGPALSITKAFLEKTTRCSLTSSYNKTTAEKVNPCSLVTSRLNVTYTPPAKENNKTGHSFSLGLNFLRKLNGENENGPYSELTGTLNYTYTF